MEHVTTMGRRFLFFALLWVLALGASDDGASSPTPSPTIWWANEFLWFTYFELYFIGTGILLGSFLLCFCCCTYLFKNEHPLNTIINFFEDLARARSKRIDERFRESSTLLGKGVRSDA